MNNENKNAARVFCAAIETIANKPENLANLEFYLTLHFTEWLEKYAGTPCELAAEMREFAEMII